MVSYKKLYEETLAKLKDLKEITWEKTEYECPECKSQLLIDSDGIEIICSNKNCNFDKITIDAIYEIMKYFGAKQNQNLKC